MSPEVHRMSDETLLSWTPANWITVVLMVTLGFAIVGAVARILKIRNGGAA